MQKSSEKQTPDHQTDKSESILIDVKRPGFDYGHLGHHATINIKNELSVITSKKKGTTERVVEMIIGLLLFGICLSGILIIVEQLKNTGEAAEEIGAVVTNFSDATEALKNKEYSEANDSLKKNQQSIKELENIYADGYGQTLRKVLGSLIPSISESIKFMQQIALVNTSLIEYAANQQSFEAEWLQLFIKKDDSLEKRLVMMRDQSRKILDDLVGMQAQFQKVQALGIQDKKTDTILKETYLAQTKYLSEWNSFYESLVAANATSSEKSLILVYYDKNIPRPGGGALKALSLIKRASSSISSIVHLPAKSLNASGAFAEPPQELRSRGADWKGEDLLWFDSPKKNANLINERLKNGTSTENQTLTAFIDISLLDQFLKKLKPASTSSAPQKIDLASFEAALLRDGASISSKKTGPAQESWQSLLQRLLDSFSHDSTVFPLETPPSLAEVKANRNIFFASNREEINSILKRSQIFIEPYEPKENGLEYLIAPRLTQLNKDPIPESLTLNITGNIHIDTDKSLLADMKIKADSSASAAAKKTSYLLKLFTNPKTQFLTLKGIRLNEIAYHTTQKVHEELQKEIDETVYLPSLGVELLNGVGRSAIKAFTEDIKKEAVEFRSVLHGRSKDEVNVGDTFRFVFEPQIGLSASINYRIYAPVGFRFKESDSPTYIISGSTSQVRLVTELTLTK